MDDRELLELAAKAAGVTGGWGDKIEYHNGAVDLRDVWILEGDDFVPWNPLTDDGDALRLAVELGLSARRFGNLIEVCGAKAGGAHGLILDEPIGDDGVLAAYRRGFTRAAAEIGRAM
jgi:hypothetical protein